MRHPIRVLVFAAAILVPALLGAPSCGGGDDDDSCDGAITSNCAACTCEAGKKTTCTAYPKGDETSNQRCCVCSD